jgi:nitrate reductase gamma subunit
MSPLLKTLENEVQIVALLFMAAVYGLRLVWLFRFKSRKERTFAEGSAAAGIGHSLLNIAMPWAVESARKKLGFYLQFVIFHLGVAAAISATFIIPYAPRVFEVKTVVRLFQVMLSAAFLVGLMRLFRRLKEPAIRLISTVDDYASLVLMVLFFAAGFLAVPNAYRSSEAALIAFFALTAFFLVYVPFSKIGHYLYYPFTHFFLGRTMGHRGVYPIKRGEKREGR